MQVSNLIGAPYRHGRYRARSRAVFQNKAMYGQYRAVGHPIACAVTEGLIDLAADALAADPAEFRRRSYVPAHAYPYRTPSGVEIERLSQHEAHGRACLASGTISPTFRTLAVVEAYAAEHGASYTGLRSEPGAGLVLNRLLSAVSPSPHSVFRRL